MDDLTKLKFVGKAIAGKLAAAGITSYAALAAADAEALRAKAELKPTDDVAAWIKEAGEFVARAEEEAKAKAKAEAEAREKAGAEKKDKGKAAQPKGPQATVVLLADGKHGKKGDRVTLLRAEAASLRRAGGARRLLLSDIVRT